MNKSNISPKSHFSSLWRVVFPLLIIAVFVSFAAGGVVYGEVLMKATGTITAIEDATSELEETVTIDNRGYIVRDSTRITNSRRKRIKLEEMNLPARIEFEYVNTEKGPVIRKIVELGE